MSLRIALICLLATVVEIRGDCSHLEPQKDIQREKISISDAQQTCGMFCGYSKPLVLKALHNHSNEALGDWYLIYVRSPNEDERTSRCTKIIFDVTPDKKATVTWAGDKVYNTGGISFGSTPGIIVVHWKGKDFDYVITDIEYDNFTLGFSCLEGKNDNIPPYILLQSRTPDIPEETLEFFKKKLEAMNIDFSEVTKVNHEGC